MKSRGLVWIILVLALALLGLSGCTSAHAGDKLVKANPPAALTADGNPDQPSFTPGIEPTSDVDCTYTDPHPIGESIAQTYPVSYEQVMTWFCSGYSFDNILIALETSAAVDIPPDVLLDMLLEKEWEEIWEQVGLTGSP